MRFKIRLGRLVLFFSTFKVRSAYGVASYSKADRQKHFLLMDFDTRDPKDVRKIQASLLKRFTVTPMMMYQTRHGYHAIVFKQFNFKDALLELVKTPCIDLGWVSIGIGRGYWFLENTVAIPKMVRSYAKDLTFMRIERAIGEDQLAQVNANMVR